MNIRALNEANFKEVETNTLIAIANLIAAEIKLLQAKQAEIARELNDRASLVDVNYWR